MKNKAILISILAASLLLSTTALAYPKGLGELKIFGLTNSFRMPLVQKNPSDWSVVEDGAWGLLQGKFGEYLMFDGHGLKPMTSYQLIYYGYDTHNDEWPYATCLREVTTSKAGTTGNVVAYYSYDTANAEKPTPIGHKIWLVLSSDVDCTGHMMTAWNPTEYLFEWNTI